MAKLRLDRLDGLAPGGGLAGHRVAADVVMAELPETEGPLHGPEGPLVAVEVNREGAVAREEELLSSVALPDVPTDRVDHVGCQREHQRLVALA